MTKKEIYKLALECTRETLRSYFADPTGFKDEYLQKGAKGKAMVKRIYDKLEPVLLSD